MSGVKMKYLFLACTLLLPTAGLANRTSMIDNPVIGSVEALHKNAELKNYSENISINLLDDQDFNDKLYEEVDLVTNEETRLHAVLVDGTKLMVGENSEIRLTKFLLKDKNSIGELEVVKGAFRMISGQINKTPGGKLTIKTPLVSVGIRGTDFWGLQTENDLTLALLDNGIVDITTISGEEVTLDNQMTFVVVSKDGSLSQVQELPQEVFLEAAKTVSFPE